MSFDSNPSGHLATTRLEACINDVRNWMSSNRLQLNSDKTEFLVFGFHFRHWPLLSSIVIGNDSISPSDSKSFCGNVVLSTTRDSEGYHASLKGNSVVHWNKRFTIGRNKAGVH